MVPATLYCSTYGLASVLFAFRESNAAGKAIVFLLFVGSIYAWSIMVTKYVELRKAKGTSDIQVDGLWNSGRPGTARESFSGKDDQGLQAQAYASSQNQTRMRIRPLTWRPGPDQDYLARNHARLSAVVISFVLTHQGLKDWLARPACWSHTYRYSLAGADRSPDLSSTF